jgi:hypothetical protein
VEAPPAASVALVILKGLTFAPALFVAGVVSDGLVDGFPLGAQPALASDAIIAVVYPVHTIIRYFLGSMTRKLSVTSSQ